MVKYFIQLKQNQTKIELDELNSISIELPKQLKNPSISTWMKSLTFFGDTKEWFVPSVLPVSTEIKIL